MVETPGIVVITKFVRSSSTVFSSYIKYMDRDEAVNGGAIHSSYSAYSEEYMGYPEKTTGLFSMDYDQLSEEIAQMLAPVCKKVVGVEIIEEAVAAA